MSAELRALALKLSLEMENAERSAPLLPRREHHIGKGGGSLRCVVCEGSRATSVGHEAGCPVAFVQEAIAPYLVPWTERTAEERAIAEASEARFATWLTGEQARLAREATP